MIIYIETKFSINNKIIKMKKKISSFLFQQSHTLPCSPSFDSARQINELSVD